MEFHRTVRAAFLGFAAAAPDRYVVLDAAQPAARVAAAAEAAVMERIAGVTE